MESPTQPPDLTPANESGLPPAPIAVNGGVLPAPAPAVPSPSTPANITAKPTAPVHAANDNPPITANDNDGYIGGFGPSSFTGITPPHTHTESTLAPTSEFMRYVLAALPSRYILRGTMGLGFNDPKDRPQGLAGWFLDSFGSAGDFFNRKFGMNREHAEAALYSSSLGVGSLTLTAMYSKTVYADIKNIFSEAVGAEFNKPADKVTYADLKHSDNKIVNRTLDNFWKRMLHRLAIDVLFFPAAFVRHASAGDLVLGLKGAQLFMETWKRKTTMFEDLVGFVNNKINPRNGLGQPIVVGEVFDLYQHYEQEFAPDRAFRNVLEHGGGEDVVWLKSEPIFRRITELMNQTYAYKHPTIVDPVSGVPIRQANFALPTLIYLLGHDLIDIRNPERTQITIEVANRHGIPGVKAMQEMMAQGAPLPMVMQHFQVQIPAPQQHTANDGKNQNGVIIKGSSVQLDHAAPSTAHPTHPHSHIDAGSAQHALLQNAALHLA